MSGSPLVSVTMPAYNAEKYIKETIESVLNQSFRDFELIIVNDASTDGTKDVVLSLNDPRIRYYENDVNSGIVATRNHCLRRSAGKYIAVLDSDDISMPDRLEKQVKFLEANTGYGLCGTFYRVIDSDGNPSVNIEVPTSFPDIKTFLVFNTCFCHSSVMIRRELINESGFTTGYDIIEDYEMAYRLSEMTKLANLPEFLTQYRVHGKNQTISNAVKVLSLRKKLDARILNDLQIEFTERELAIHSNFINSNFDFFKTNDDLVQLETWLLKLYGLLGSHKEFNKAVIIRIMIKRWILLFYSRRKISLRFLNTRLLRKFKAAFIIYFFEFVRDRFSNRLKVV
jgi:glycosyltransferase involved in cell wall biosynthesis